MNLIITAATGYQASQLFPFLDSIKKNCSNVKVIIIIYKRDIQTINILKNRYSFLEFINVPFRNKFIVKIFRLINDQLADREYLSKNQILKSLRHNFLHIAIKRYLIALELVKAHRDSVSNVLLADSRDVILQADPFALINSEVISGLESERMTIGRCAINSAWIRRLYGDEGLSKVESQRIICSGVSIGPVHKIEQYLTDMCKEIEANLPRIASSDSIDQGIHNYLIYTGKTSNKTVENKLGFIATLGYEDPTILSKDKKTGLIRIHDKYPAIVHQYDRHPILTKTSS